MLLQLWVRPALAHLLPAPIAYYIIKQLSNLTGFTQFMVTKLLTVKCLVWRWVEDRYDLFFPPPLLFILSISYKAERKIIHGIKTYLDVIVTGLMILCMVLGFTVTTIFISFQVYTESVYIVQSLTSITSNLNVSDSYIFMKINDSFVGSGYDSMENVMDGAYNYSRDWISQTLRHSLADADGTARKDLELKVLNLWDRSYQYWVTDQRNIPGSISKVRVGDDLGELLSQLYSSSHVFNVSAIQTFAQNNMGTLTSIVEQVWALFKGNIGFFLDTCLGIGRIILHSGSGVVNFVFGIFIYLTALFYLLSNSAESYIPMEVVSQYSIFQISGVGSAVQKAVNSVFLITIKMSVFYLLWTYVTHVVFDASIVVLPILFSSFIAACPFTGQHIVALPAAIELYCLQQRPIAALLLVTAQVAPSWLVDTAIYSEVRGGIHPWFTGLAVVGGTKLAFNTRVVNIHQLQLINSYRGVRVWGAGRYLRPPGAVRAVRHHQRLLHLHRRHGAGRHARGARRRRTHPHPRPEVHADTLGNRGLTRLGIEFEDLDLLLSVKLSTVICSVGGKPKLILNFSPILYIQNSQIHSCSLLG